MKDLHALQFSFISPGGLVVQTVLTKLFLLKKKTLEIYTDLLSDQADLKVKEGSEELFGSGPSRYNPFTRLFGRVSLESSLQNFCEIFIRHKVIEWDLLSR